jgi:uncharacterized protein (DUF3084 family)
MFGVRLIVILALMGGIIAYIADKLGSKIGKKRLTIFGLRPHKTSVLLTVLSGILIAACTIGVLAVASQSARTALFGMDKLQKEMASLTEQKKAAQSQLDDALAALRDKNVAIAKLDEAIKNAQSAREAAEGNLAKAQGELATARDQYAAAQSGLVAAHSEVDNLTAAKAKLNEEIKALNTETDKLKQGLLTMKEGHVLYRSGEVVFAGVLQGGQNDAEVEKQVKWLVKNANVAALERLGLNPAADVEPVWIMKDEYDRLSTALKNSKTDLLVRVRAVSNIIAGQPVVCALNIYPNRKIFSNGTLIYRTVVDMDETRIPTETKFMLFLNNVNKLTVQAGVLPDPVSGKVGAMDAASILETEKKMQRAGGKVLLSAYADGDIATAGPVRLKIDVERIADASR